MEKNSNAQLGRSMEISLPREWSREEQILYTDEYIQRNFVDKGMCADWAIHDKGDGNPHVHLLLTLRPFEEDHIRNLFTAGLACGADNKGLLGENGL